MAVLDEATGPGGGAGAGAARAVDAAALARAAVALLGGEPSGSLGGLAGVRAAFERAGLAAEFQSWVGTGPNRPITPAELERALGADAVGGLARSVGAEPSRVAAGLAELLPRVVDQLTPAGVLPDGAGEPAALARRLLGR
jgi:uncharacterized protein YidB (DUF937 family)